MKRRLLVAAALLLAAIPFVLRALLGLHTVAAGADPLPPAEAVAAYDQLLRQHVHPDGVDYDALVQDPRLRQYAATIAEWGPRTAPGDFPTTAHKLAYWINAYNALTLLGIVHHYPLDTLHEVRGVLEIKPGVGFFYLQRFRLDGRKVNLYDLENTTIRGLGDARIHAAINCASASCPTLESVVFGAEELDDRLDSATRIFASTPPHVAVDDASRQIRLSSIFQWFAGDFEQHMGKLGKPAEVLTFIEHYADPPVAAAVSKAREAGYAVVHVDYDWSLNRRGSVAAFREGR